MNIKYSKRISSLGVSNEEEPIITLFPCEYDSEEEEENDFINSSKNSIDSSELVDDSEDEPQLVTKIYTIIQNVDITGEKSCENNDVIILV